MMNAIQVHRFGGPDMLELQSVAAPLATGDQVIVRNAWAGVVYLDIVQRQGRFPGLTPPYCPGLEGSGVVLSAPEGGAWRAGDRVAYTTGVLGSYAEQVAVPAGHLVRVPDALSLELACATLEQGLTADMLVNDVARLRDGDTVLVHAAAGGVGGLLVQMLLARGLRVLGTVSSQPKADWLHSLGASALRYDAGRDWAAEALALTGGRGVAVVFDSVGQATVEHSLQVLAPCGHLVLFGAASGPPAPIDPARLMQQSLTVTRPVLRHYVAGTLQARAARLFTALGERSLRQRIHACLPLSEAGAAQALLESRGTLGKVLLQVGGSDAQ